MNKRFQINIHLAMLPDLLIAVLMLTAYVYRHALPSSFLFNTVLASGILLVLKMILAVMLHSGFNARIQHIINTIHEFKKGRFSPPTSESSVPLYIPQIGSEYFTYISDELSILGKHFETLLSSQKNEIENLRELYNNIVLSISSYFLALNGRGEVIFANESFLRKFQMAPDDVIGQKVENVFIFLTSTIRDSIKTVLETQEPVILEKTHLVSANRISIIADIKISQMRLRGETQINFVIDDVTNVCKKDFQINLISQVSESIQGEGEIDNVINALLTGVTSGSGLGFNRAMLFLLDVPRQMLAGRMAVGPDTIDEAIEIWSSVSSCDVNIFSQLKSSNGGVKKGRTFLEKVRAKSFSTGDDNIITRSLKNRENIHVYDAWNDPRVGEDIREFLDVREFVITPLMSINNPIGVIIADNKFNQAPISNDNLELLSIFAFQATLLIESYNNLHLIKKEMQKVRDRQEAMLESEKLAAVGRIASHIAHEIRNPLVTMGGYARRILQLSQNAGWKNADRISTAAAVVLKESERLEKTLSNVMDFSRTTNFILEFNNINDIIHDTHDLLKNLLQERRIRFSMYLDPDLPLVKSDFNQMKQVMLNLLQNAIDATPPGGDIDVVTETIDNHLMIRVIDTGTGIQSEDIMHVFEPFFTTKVTGVGLGLSITKKIINDHDGEITALKREGGGTEFRISLKIPG
jgi:signal transduction histidine kinase/PAS domain-containing protein